MSFLMGVALLNSFAELGDKAKVIGRSGYTVVFGESSLQESQLPSEAFYLKQIHGNRVVQAQTIAQEADGHYSSLPGSCLVIRTADCLPVFFSSSTAIFALHIGWRGLRARIMSEALKLLPTQSPIEVFVGPHIQAPSFELDQENAESLLKAHHLSLRTALRANIIYPSLRQTRHYHVHLVEILRLEVQGHQKVEWTISGIDTFRSAVHCSYRRKALQVGRNLSFIFKHK